NSDGPIVDIRGIRSSSSIAPFGLRRKQASRCTRARGSLRPTTWHRVGLISSVLLMVLQVVPILSQPVLADSWTETSVSDFTGGTLQEVVATAPGDLPRTVARWPRVDGQRNCAPARCGMGRDHRGHTVGCAHQRRVSYVLHWVRRIR